MDTYSQWDRNKVYHRHFFVGLAFFFVRMEEIDKFASSW